MSGLTAQVRITTADGYPLQFPVRAGALRAVSRVNGVGYFEMALSAGAYPRGLFALDRRVELSLQAAGRAPVLAFIGLMRLYQESGPVSTYTVDYRDEINYVYVGGAGQGAARTVRERSDAARMAASSLNRREGFGAYTNATDTDVLDAHGDKLLREGRVRTTLERDLGTLQPWVYGLDWALGDTLTVAADAPETITIGGPCWHDVLARRVVAYPTDSSEAKKKGYADALLRAYVDENLLSATDTARNLPTAWGMTLAPVYDAAREVTHSATYGNLLAVLQEVAEKAQLAGTPVRFGCAPVWDGSRYVPRFEVRLPRWGVARHWILGTGPQSQAAEIAAIDIQVDGRGVATVTGKTEDTA